MGHLIGGGFLRATTKEAALREAQGAAEDFAYYNGDREEGSDNYSGNIRFFDKTFDTEDEAKEYFDSLGSFVDGVVIVKEAGKGAQNRYQKKMAAIRAKRKQFEDSLIEKFKERTSKSIGCKKCGTRIPSDIALRRNLHCPNCYNWLVTDAVKARYEKFDKQEELAKEQYAKDCAESGKPRFWAKYEIHI